MMSTFKNQFLASLAILFCLLMISCAENQKSDPAEQVRAQRDSLAQQLEIQQQTIDSMLQNIQTSEIKEDYPIMFGIDFREIENPEEFITSSLKKRTELIPLEAVLGGTMSYRKIDVLSEKWVMALYDDGHIQGQAIYQYRLLPNDSLEFSIRLYNHP